MCKTTHVSLSIVYGVLLRSPGSSFFGEGDPLLSYWLLLKTFLM